MISVNEFICKTDSETFEKALANLGADHPRSTGDGALENVRVENVVTVSKK